MRGQEPHILPKNHISVSDKKNTSKTWMGCTQGFVFFFMSDYSLVVLYQSNEYGVNIGGEPICRVVASTVQDLKHEIAQVTHIEMERQQLFYFEKVLHERVHKQTLSGSKK